MTNAQLAESYLKLCQEHPLLTYIEDPFVDQDIDGFNKLKTMLGDGGLPNV